MLNVYTAVNSKPTTIGQMTDERRNGGRILKTIDYHSDNIEWKIFNRNREFKNDHLSRGRISVKVRISVCQPDIVFQKFLFGKVVYKWCTSGKCYALNLRYLQFI